MNYSELEPKTELLEFIDYIYIFIGIKLIPGSLYPLINIPMHEIKDKSVFTDLINYKLFSILNDFNDKHDFINSIQNRLMNHYDNSKELHNAIKKAVNLIISTKGKINIKELSRETCMCPRNLERRFKHYVGISPKELCRLIRFNNIRKIAISKKILIIKNYGGIYEKKLYNIIITYFRIIYYVF